MKRLLLGGICLLLLGLAACGREAKKGPFTVLLSVEANTLDPHFATATIEWSILMNMFDPLIERRDDMRLAPALAERWEVDETKKVWTFHLRKGVKFHNGEPFDSESVRYTFERMRDKKLKPRITVYRRIFLDRIEKVDSHTVKIHTRRPVATLPVWMVNAFMLPPKYYSSTSPKELLKKPVGTGPYKLVKWIKDDRIEMEANKGWWRGKPAIDEVVWRPVSEASARIGELETGGADVIVNISPDQSKTILAREEGLQLKGARGGRRIYLGIRMDHGVLGDPRVRRALNHAIDFGAIVKNVFLGHGSRMRSIVNAPNADPNMKAYAYDPQKAKALLAEAGLKDANGDGVLEANGEPFELKLEVPASRYLKGKGDIGIHSGLFPRRGRPVWRSFPWSGPFSSLEEEKRRWRPCIFTGSVPLSTKNSIWACCVPTFSPTSPPGETGSLWKTTRSSARHSTPMSAGGSATGCSASFMRKALGCFYGTSMIFSASAPERSGLPGRMRESTCPRFG